MMSSGRGTQSKDCSTTVYGDSCEFCKGPMIPRPGKRFCDKDCKDAHHQLARMIGELKLQSKGIKYAKLATSKRLQRLLKFLSDCKPHTTKEIFVGANICAVNTAVTELRRNGFDILCRFKEAVQDGSRIYEYQLCKHEGAI